jgi:hypothetical protein
VPEASGITRRRLLEVGGVAGAAVLLGVRPFSPASASAASDVPDYLLRSSYLDLTSPDFAISGGGSARLLGVSDLIGGKDLLGSEDAFALGFQTSRPLEQGIHTLSNPELGRFDIFLAPDSARDDTFSVIVNRSVGAPRHSRVPKPPQRAAADAKKPAAPKRHEVVRHIALRRSRKGLLCDVKIDPDAHLEGVTVWLMRGERLVATAARHTHKHHTVLRLRTKRRARRGRYTLAVIANGPGGAQHGRRKNVTLR